MAVDSPYLAANNLHFKPLSARLDRGVLDLTTSMQKSASSTHWQGRTVQLLTKSVIIAGTLVTIPVALIELVAGLCITLVAYSFNRLAFAGKSELLQKYTLKPFSYTLHCAILTAFSFPQLISPIAGSYYSGNALTDHLFHLGSSGLAQWVYGVPNPDLRNNPAVVLNRVQNLFRDSHPHLLNDFITQIQRDFSITVQTPNIEGYLSRHPHTQNFIQNLNIQQLLRDPLYQQTALQLAAEFLVEQRILLANLEINDRSTEESAYQEHLAQLLKESFLEIHGTEVLSECLNTQESSGQELLEMLDASIYLPLTTYTQYKELLKPILCPARFSGDRSRYNTRLEDLRIAKQQLCDELSFADRRLLEQKILRGNLEVPPLIQDLYVKIGALAQPLYQGPLIQKMRLNLQNVSSMNIFETVNLFENACRQALAEIEQEEGE